MLASPTDPRDTMPPMSPLQRKQVPNVLTIGRLVLAIGLFIILALHEGVGPEGSEPDLALIWAAVLFIVAAITDALDGHFARKWDAVSRFGRVMDPVADKVLVLGSLVFLAGPGFQTTIGDETFHLSGLTSWMVVVVLARELLVTSIRAAYESTGIPFPAGWSGKAKMILQSIVVPAVLLVLAFDPTPTRQLRLTIDITMWIMVVVTAWSALPYIGRAITIERNKA